MLKKNSNCEEVTGGNKRTRSKTDKTGFKKTYNDLGNKGKVRYYWNRFYY